MAKRKSSVPAKRSRAPAVPVGQALLRDVIDLIREAREATATAVNAALVHLYWRVGSRIRTEVRKEQRAEYGRQILSTLSRELVAEFGNGYSVQNLYRMTRLAEVFPESTILSTLSRELSWSHFIEIIGMDDPLKRDFYAEMCRVERWSVRTLRKKIGGLLFERTALSRKPEELAKQELTRLRDSDQLTPDLVFRDPYLLSFLGLKDRYSEYDLESAILREIQQFILEIGTGFAFVAQQKRLVIDGKDFYIDLLFFHRKLRRLVAIDLKLGVFEA